MSKHYVNDDDARNYMQSQPKDNHYHYPELHFTLVRLSDEYGSIVSDSTNRNISPNDDTTDAATSATGPIKSPIAICGNNNNTPTTIYGWLEYIESFYRRSSDFGHDTIASTVPSSVSTTILQSQPSPLSVWEQTKHNILQYIQNKDRYTNLASILLKSYAYYYYSNVSRYHSTLIPPSRSLLRRPSTHVPTRPIVILPRTNFNQPYIPHCGNPSTSIITTSLFSISHQYPIVALIQQQQPVVMDINENGGDSLSSPAVEMETMMVGLDVVIFDAHYSPKLYSNFMEYIQVYEEYFTPHEWNDCIMANINGISDGTRYDDIDVLREFYIQWSIKEAYTKALGLGMNIDFQCFETEIDRSTSCVIAAALDRDSDNLNDRTILKTKPRRVLDCDALNYDHHESAYRLWEWIRRQCCAAMVESSNDYTGAQHRQHVVVCTVGTVTTTKHSTERINVPQPQESRPKEEQYYFYFYPIFNDNDNNTNDTSGSHTEMIGCATICYGPIQKIPFPRDPMTKGAQFPPVSIQYTTLQKLIEYHTTTAT